MWNPRPERQREETCSGRGLRHFAVTTFLKEETKHIRDLGDPFLRELSAFPCRGNSSATAAEMVADLLLEWRNDSVLINKQEEREIVTTLS